MTSEQLRRTGRRRREACAAAVLLMVTAGCGDTPSTGNDAADASRTAVAGAATAASRIIASHGKIASLDGRWEGCTDRGAQLRYLVQGRLDQPAGANPAVDPLASDLASSDWTITYYHGSTERPVTGLSKDGIDIELAQDSAATVLFRLTGRCLDIPGDIAGRLRQQEASSIDHA